VDDFSPYYHNTYLHDMYTNTTEIRCFFFFVNAYITNITVNVFNGVNELLIIIIIIIIISDLER